MVVNPENFIIDNLCFHHVNLSVATELLKMVCSTHALRYLYMNVSLCHPASYTFQGVFWGLIIGQVIGSIRLILDMVMPSPVCGSGEPDKRMSILSHVDFLHFAIINAIICGISMVGISLLTKPRTEKQVSTAIYTKVCGPI